MVRSKRIISIDILRTFAILSSVILHFQYKADITDLAIVFNSIWDNLFSVGVIFIFVSGIMSYLVYLPRFKIAPSATSKKLLLKGVYLFIIYIVYVNALRLIKGEIIPLGDPLSFLFSHPFFTKVLLIFSMLYICAPVFLYLFSRKRKQVIIFFLFLLFTIAPVIILHYFNPSNFWRILFLSRKEFIYALIPMLSVYVLGMAVGDFYSKLKDKAVILKRYSYFIIFFVILFYITGFVLIFLLPKLILNIKLLLELLNLILVISLIEYFLKNNFKMQNNKLSDLVFSVGRQSLLAYVSANVLISLMPDISSMPIAMQYLLLFAIILFTYVLCEIYLYATKKNI